LYSVIIKYKFSGRYSYIVVNYLVSVVSVSVSANWR